MNGKGTFLIGGNRDGNHRNTELVKTDGTVERAFNLKYETQLGRTCKSFKTNFCEIGEPVS